jgi:addiction module RelE/StbE family toxin
VAKITWSLEALADVSEIGLFIERSSKHFAEVIVNRLYSSVDRLIEFPLSGREVSELPDDSSREIIVDGYRIIYDVHNDSVKILAVLSGRQDLKKKLKG